MENLQKIYKSNINNILGSNVEYFNNLREELIKSYNLNTKSAKNNESIKNLDPSILKNFEFNINKQTLNYELFNNNESVSSIVIKDGLNYKVNNFDKRKVSFDIINSNFDILINNLKKHKNNFVNDYIVNLNSILLNSGFFLKLHEPINLTINLVHNNQNLNNTIYAKNFFHVCKNSNKILIEKFDDKSSSNTNIINCFELEEGSSVHHFVLQNNKNKSKLQYTTNTNCYGNSKFNQLIFNISETSGRNHHFANLLGKNSNADLKGIFFASRDQIIDNKTTINHIETDCISKQTYKGVLTDNSKASYLSKTHVESQAQKTDGYQLSKGILLSEKSFFHSKPELKIYADDVKCSHGSTIGPFDNQVIFYLRSRGISEVNEKSLLIKSFYNDLLNSIKDNIFLNDINVLVDEWLFHNVK